MASIGSPLPVTENLPGWIVAGVVASIALLLHRLSTGPQISHFPLLGKEYGSRRKRIEAFLFRPVEVYQNGYQKFKDEIYRITMPDSEHTRLAPLAVISNETWLVHLTRSRLSNKSKY